MQAGLAIRPLTFRDIFLADVDFLVVWILVAHYRPIINYSGWRKHRRRRDPSCCRPSRQTAWIAAMLPKIVPA